MKKYLFLIAALLLIAWGAAWAWMGPAGMAGSVAATAPSECDSYDLFCENFEGTGYENDTCGTGPCVTETAGDPSQDCVTGTSNCPLRGDQSLYYSANGQTVRLVQAATAANPSWHFLINVDTLPSDTLDMISIRDAADNQLAKVMMIVTGAMYVQATGGSSANTFTASADTEYHVWLDFVAATGVATLTVDTDTTKAGGTAGSSDGTNSAANSNSVLISSGYGIRLVVDQTYGNSTTFASVPE